MSGEPLRPPARERILVLALAAVLELASCAPTSEAAVTPPASSAAASPPPFGTRSPEPTPVPTPAPATLVGAGDIAACGSAATEATARLVESIPGTVFTAGDNAYERGSAAEFANCYAPTWGRVRDRTRPAPGNHEYLTNGAAGYFGYFGAAAGERGQGYYSYELGQWHVVVLNSECAFVGGCGASSAQTQWLAADLAAHRTTCALAIWHQPRFSSGLEHGSDATYDAFWRVLYANGVDVVINGHDHDYERFAPQDPDARRDDSRGIREFVVGTGGRSLYAVGAPIANSEVLRNDTYGVLRLTLRADGYDWAFIPIPGSGFSDVGSASCH